MSTVKQPVTIDGISFDALIDESKQYEADVPAYPVERGFEVSDAIILKPFVLSMTLFLTNTPVTWRTLHGSNPARVEDVIKRLETLYFTREPVTVITSERTYRNMAILNFELKKSLETGNSREIPITFREIRVTEAQTMTIPASYGKSGATGANAGTASVTSRGSILHGFASGTRLIP